MGVLSACKDLQSGCGLCAKGVVGEHSLYSKLHCHFGLGCHQGLVLNFLQTADVTGVTAIVLLLQLSAGQNCLICVNDHNEVTAVYVGGESGIVLAAEQVSSSNSGSAEGLVRCVDNVPLTNYRFFLLPVP